MKGGRLAELAYPAKITQLILSDVPGDNLETIASGISAPDPVPYSETISTIRSLGLLNKDFISKYIEKIEKGQTNKPLEKTNKIFDNVKSIIDEINVHGSINENKSTTIISDTNNNNNNDVNNKAAMSKYITQNSALFLSFIKIFFCVF